MNINEVLVVILLYRVKTTILEKDSISLIIKTITVTAGTFWRKLLSKNRPGSIE